MLISNAGLPKVIQSRLKLITNSICNNSQSWGSAYLTIEKNSHLGTVWRGPIYSTSLSSYASSSPGSPESKYKKLWTWTKSSYTLKSRVSSSQLIAKDQKKTYRLSSNLPPDTLMTSNCLTRSGTSAEPGANSMNRLSLDRSMTYKLNLRQMNFLSKGNKIKKPII